MMAVSDHQKIVVFVVIISSHVVLYFLVSCPIFCPMFLSSFDGNHVTVCCVLFVVCECYYIEYLSVQCNSWHWTDIKSLECLSVCVFVCVCVRKTFRPR